VKRACWLLSVSVLLLVLGVVSACGQGDAIADPGPEAVHAAWVAAMRANERDVARDLVASMGGSEAVFVDTALSRMQHILRDQSNGTIATGPLLGVDTLPLQDAGQGKVGTSVWRWEQQTWCWETQLVAEEGRWKVAGWKQRLHCPAGV
jgi:hypothetical protein